MLDCLKNNPNLNVSNSLKESHFSKPSSITLENVNDFLNTVKKVAVGSMTSFFIWQTLNNPLPMTASVETDLITSGAVLGLTYALFDYSSEGLEKTCRNVFLSSIVPLAISYPIIPLCAAYSFSAKFTVGLHAATLLATTTLVPMAAKLREN
ncbi:MAG: hypothetical protein S4CHLAM6_13950 [Chlamydiae bacterium]|nr:hypothetical protein [Chlamydiota bacterium]